MDGSRRLCFVDTSILVCAFDRLEVEKHRTAVQLIEGLWQTKKGVLSTQVLEEFHLAILRPKGLGISLKVSREIMLAFSYWPVYSPNVNDLLKAVELQEHTPLTFHQALICQSAAAAKCGVIYSEDLPAGQTFAGVRVSNPFLAVPTPPGMDDLAG